ncbi:ABC transporter permease [Halosimplex litoreum]|uniref:ABC transporter permease n=2 Tax=Halosimplex litoreum TaxID=1198301 RepID=A0A7U3WT77_9EURY|nr:ABC transporter permease [Halosimplex litoreum]
MARRNIARTKVRSVLAALGIVIGVIAIASLGMFGLTLRYQLTENLGDIANEVTVEPNREDVRTPRAISRREVRDIRRIAGSSASVVPIQQQNLPVSLDRGPPSNRFVQSVESPAAVYDAAEGSIPENFRSGVLVGQGIAAENDIDPGSTIAINGTSTPVRAVLAPGDSVGFLPSENAIVVPSSSFDRRGYYRVIVQAEDGGAANETAMALRERLNERRDRFTVDDNSDLADQIGQTFRALNLFLLGIGSISLLVAGVSILNVMLMSTVERRQEIGVLRAVGFQKRDVLKIMLSEAVLLGIVGGIAGAAFSIVAGMVINHFILGDATLAFRPGNFLYIGLAFAFGVGTSLLSGLYPAWKAANERPVEALRS